MALKGWLLVNGFLQGPKFQAIYDRLLAAARSRRVSLDLIKNQELLVDLSSELPLQEQVRLLLADRPQPDFILFWDKDHLLAAYLEKCGFRLFNSARAIAVCDHKSKTQLALEGSGLPMPRTILAPMTFAGIGYGQTSFLEPVIGRLGLPLVVKAALGSFGQEVYLCRTEDDILKILQARAGQDLLFQEYIAASHGRDLRLQVVGNRVIGAILRQSDPQANDFRANLTLGGRMSAHRPTDRESSLALQVARQLGLDFAGIDLLFGPDGQPWLCEVNSNAHFQKFDQATGLDTADQIIKWIIRQMTKEVLVCPDP